MVKIHTRTKRLKGIRSTTRKHRFYFTRVEKKIGPKSFATKELAEKWADETKLDKKAHVLLELKSKFQWRATPKV